MNNNTVAILSLVNQLAEDWNVKPWEFVAEYQPDNRGQEVGGHILTDTHLQIRARNPKDARVIEQLGRMAESLRMTSSTIENTWMLDGTDQTIGEALEAAIRMAPKTPDFGKKMARERATAVGASASPATA